MQRLTLRRAYLSAKPIVIRDEPTAGQDAESLERCAALIREMRKEKTVLIITHDPELIAGACDRCIGLSDGHAEIGQHRTIWQEHSAKDFASYESYKRAGILYVFPPFITARMGQTIGRWPLTQLSGDALDKADDRVNILC